MCACGSGCVRSSLCGRLVLKSGAVTGELGAGPQRERFREVRRNVAASVLPLTTWVDGRRFSFQRALADALMLVVGAWRGSQVGESGAAPASRLARRRLIAVHRARAAGGLESRF